MSISLLPGNISWKCCKIKHASSYVWSNCDTLLSAMLGSLLALHALSTRAQGLCPSLASAPTVLSQERFAAEAPAWLWESPGQPSTPSSLRDHGTCSNSNWHARNEREGQTAKGLIDHSTATKRRETCRARKRSDTSFQRMEQDQSKSEIKGKKGQMHTKLEWVKRSKEELVSHLYGRKLVKPHRGFIDIFSPWKFCESAKRINTFFHIKTRWTPM